MTESLGTKSRRKIAIVHPGLRIGGGSEACALWMLEALKSDYDLTLINTNPVDLEEYNRFYHTRLGPGEIATITVSPPRWLRSHRRFIALRACRLAAFCKEHAGDYDLMISSYNQMDFGRPGIQYILDPNYNQKMLSLLNPSPSRWKRWFYLDSFWRDIYMKTSRALSGYTEEGMKQNRTLVDSDWAGRLIRDYFGLETATLYPPVFDQIPGRPWDEREPGFVCIGRIVPDKQIETLIRIVGELRIHFAGLHLHILGRVGDPNYARRLKALIKGKEEWVCWEGPVSAEGKGRIVASHKYGIHGKSNEPFGIAAAEMALAGCLVWVPGGGGQTEIVDHGDLTYGTPAEAVEKIGRILRDPLLESSLRDHLKIRARRFSLENFLNDVRAVVADFFGRRERSGRPVMP